MLLSTDISGIGRTLPYEEAVRIYAQAGFDALDFSIGNRYLEYPDGEGKARQLRSLAESLGVSFRQAHAPFRFTGWGEEGMFENTVLPTVTHAMKIAAIAGVPIIVVHPIKYLPYDTHQAQLYEMNLDYYRRLIPYCEEYGICVAAENMYGADPKRNRFCPSVCHSAEEFNRLLDDLNSPWVKGCLDVGHSALTGGEPQDMIRKMGASHIHALHIHDVDYVLDLHTVPYNGKLDWDAITQALGEIGYAGDFTFEADNFFTGLDPALIPSAARYLHDVGRLLISKVEAARK